MNKELVSIFLPCYNEAGNVGRMADVLVDIMDKEPYDYEIIFVDNASTDGTQEILRELAGKNEKIKVAIRTRNYGRGSRVAKSGHQFINGDVIIMLPSDFQEPPELIPDFLRKYEEGYKAVCGQKTGSEEGNVKYRFRQIYYRIMMDLSETPFIPNLSGIILMTKDILQQIKKSDKGAFRYAIADMGYEVGVIPYQQKARTYGKSTYSILGLLNFAITTMVCNSTAPLRIMTISGFMFSVITFIIGMIYLIWKIINWNKFTMGTAPLLIGMFFLGSIILFGLGVLGEYIGVILGRVTSLPDVQYKELINIKERGNENICSS